MPVNLASLNAASGVTVRFPFTISFILGSRSEAAPQPPTTPAAAALGS